jgi:hypothetical protein
VRPFHAEGQLQLGVAIALRVEFFEENTRLDVGVVLGGDNGEEKRGTGALADNPI